tara:strand:+ start:4444 stop:5175 length:732 start_codon:yes stop_codon:yes gene_type:complete
MAIDLAKMREKLQASEDGGRGKRDNAFWKPSEGDQEIRLVPTEDGDPFKVFHFHYNMGEAARGGVLCPKRQFGEECPICEFASNLWKENSDESKKMAKGLFVRQRFFTPVIVRGEEDSGVKIWGYGKTIYETLLGLVLNPDYGDITDVDTGVDFTLNYTLPKAKGAFPQTNLIPKRKSSKLAKSKDQVKDILNNIPDINEIFQRKSPEDIKMILESFLSPADGPLENTSVLNSVDEAIKELTA